MLESPLCRSRQRRRLVLPALRCEDEVLRIIGLAPCAKPRGPTELPGLSQLNAAHSFARQHRHHLAFELEPELVAHPISQREQVALSGKEAFVSLEIHRSDPNPYPALYVAHATAQNHAHTQLQ